jgi:flavin reductase (DIM6/NTAB) family NADH-FMN oxidoreductase RutF
MFYDPEAAEKPLALDPFKAVVIPRPIGWISTVGADGVVNLAPYSFFNAVCDDPPVVMFASGGPTAADRRKDSHRNAEASGEFVVNMASWALREAVNLTSARVPSDVDEMALAGLERLPSVKVRPPRVAAAPVHLECRYLQTVRIEASAPEEAAAMVLGRVVGIHIRDEAIAQGRVDPRRLDPIARLGYSQYARLGEVFAMRRPQG